VIGVFCNDTQYLHQRTFHHVPPRSQNSLATPTLQTCVPCRPLSWGIWKRQVVRNAKGELLGVLQGTTDVFFFPVLFKPYKAHCFFHIWKLWPADSTPRSLPPQTSKEGECSALHRVMRAAFSICISIWENNLSSVWMPADCAIHSLTLLFSMPDIPSCVAVLGRHRPIIQSQFKTQSESI
jgi:hypothetical protein